MGMKILRYSAVVLALSLVSCEKELDFEYRDIDPILVIEASLTQSGARRRSPKLHRWTSR